ncbi:MAG TPA: hypothetical protein VGH82_05490 [Gaiellaceae bacterium]|jgi:hypothetical protein
MFRYKLHLQDGTEVGEAVYAQHVYPGEIVWAAGAKKFRIVSVVPMKDDSDVYVGLLMVEAA